MVATLKVAALSVALSALGADAACKQLEVQQNFNVSEFIRATWYVQYQQKNGYQQPDSLNCVAATYNETYHGKKKWVPFFKGEVITVFNDCRLKDGTVCNDFTNPDFKPSFAIPLCARITNPAEPAKLYVAPCLLPNFLSGDYWVAAAGPTPDNYQYAVIVAGQPTVELSDGCTTPDSCTNPSQWNCGLWVFTRDPNPDFKYIAALKDIVNEKGLSTQKLIRVDHEKCDYSGYEIKANDRPAKVENKVFV
eukprot:TRINITY_DN48079_c0_g1_i1.p1 TRINITY_DN48079_c0_g1~~TRINITY_DN48079_c0_g1_i1.p1  ORF type:complete len:250 (-),score=61.51 TRINITY_DN48079_c0_g1_i1:271-1020(-)